MLGFCSLAQLCDLPSDAGHSLVHFWPSQRPMNNHNRQLKTIYSMSPGQTGLVTDGAEGPLQVWIVACPTVRDEEAEEKGAKPNRQTSVFTWKRWEISPALSAGRTATPVLACPATPEAVSDWTSRAHSLLRLTGAYSSSCHERMRNY